MLPLLRVHQAFVWVAGDHLKFRRKNVGKFSAVSHTPPSEPLLPAATISEDSSLYCSSMYVEDGSRQWMGVLLMDPCQHRLQKAEVVASEQHRSIHTASTDDPHSTQHLSTQARSTYPHWHLGVVEIGASQQMTKNELRYP